MLPGGVSFPGVERIPPAASPALVPLGFGDEASDS